MKSLIVEPAHGFKMVDRPKPAAHDGRVVIRTKYAAICGSDRMLWNTAPGLSPGHEFSGFIEDAGSFPLRRGARVCAAEFNPCGECEYCLAGKEHLCRQMMVDNPGVTMDGAFSQYVSVRGDYVYELPDDVPLELGAIVEPVAVALHGVKYLDLRQDEPVLIWGNGPIGIYAALCAKLLGAGKVVMVGRGQGRVAFCRDFDFVDVSLSTKDADFADKLAADTPEEGFGSAADCVGLDDLDPLAERMRPGGTLVLLGMHAERLTANAMGLFLKELRIRTGLYFTARDYADAFCLVCEHQDLFLPTITARIPHDEQAVQDMFVKLFDSGTNNECKVVIEYPDP